MNINDIELKEDSQEKLQAVAGKPTKNFLFSEEFNAVVNKLKNLVVPTSLSQLSNPAINPFVRVNDLPTGSVYLHDITPVVHNTGSANTLIKSIPLTNLANGDLYYIRIGMSSTQYSETQFFLNQDFINQPMPHNGSGFFIIKRHLFVNNNQLYCVVGTNIDEVSNSGAIITPINLNTNNFLNVYSRLYNGASVTFLFFNIQKLN